MTNKKKGKLLDLIFEYAEILAEKKCIECPFRELTPSPQVKKYFAEHFNPPPLEDL